MRDIEHALIDNQLELYYQPKVNMLTGHVFGVEALLHWVHPTKGIISPFEFLPAITSTELEIKIGEWVIESALAQLTQWQKQHIHLQVSVNIASYHLHSREFINYLREALARHPSIHSKSLQLEILESSALGDLNAIKRTLSTCIDQLGVQVALDDFGTGYSSLTHLRNLPVHTVKIDQSFVRDMLVDKNDYVIIDSVIKLSDAFGHSVVAEGVETTEQGLMLIRMGCQYAQGFCISRPLPVNAFLDWYETYSPNPAWLSGSPNQRAKALD
jgi:EAL domain-containing protein (putative c-di-GMP-specific phosphodiesterase class I)